MIKTKKILLTLGTVSALGLVSAVAISCSSGLEGAASKLADKEIGTVKLLNDGKKEDATVKNSVVMITDAGHVNDKSFNQSTYEGGWLAANQFNMLPKFHNLRPTGHDKISEQYVEALSNNVKVWLTSGFLHGEPVQKFWEQNKAALEKNETIIVGTDFVPAVTAGHGIGITFKVEQSAFIVGYAAADYLATTYPSDAAKRSVYAFGGGAFDGVTGFIRGFYEGIKAFNKANKGKETEIKLSSTGKVDLSSGFDPADQKMTAAVNAAVASGATIILPVAGPATGVLLNSLKGDAQKDKLVIGVDVDQSLSYTNDSAKFFSSITKRIAQANYDVLAELYQGPAKYDLLKGFELGKKSHVVLGTFKDNLVGYAPSALAGAEKGKADASLEKGKAALEKLTDLAKDLDDAGYTAATADGAKLVDYLSKLATDAKAK
ncbi:BMP family ABC transporter substrate-binding protein [Mycoplasmopsis alligatoris]|uniref:Basic membrane protein n=1 Tax=Mycoplasmopsis alligatoris A21JP2 TaxID=747682 RepID=D4XUW5_9BACT|nr:BMP family ABC transporter substrate-binding protein [Mycoplasmopsis alligatoris]EFF41831.1 basic membrane protein [Mycoplasmopsis alligatoris A21JP2]